MRCAAPTTSSCSPGHEEYVTARAYDVVERYRDLGGNLLFLAANNFFCRVRRDGRRIVREQQWRELGRDEARPRRRPLRRLRPGATAGAVHGRRARRAAPWLFEGTGLRDGDTFGRYGIEIDARSPASPAGTIVLAHAQRPDGPRAARPS